MVIVVMDVIWRRLCVCMILGRVIYLATVLMCGGGVHSIVVLPLVARCLETIDVCIWIKFVFVFVVVTVWGSVGMFVVL